MIQFFLSFAGILTAFSAPAVAGTLEDLIQSGVLPKIQSNLFLLSH
jgi:hypothetical protein